MDSNGHPFDPLDFDNLLPFDPLPFLQAMLGSMWAHDVDISDPVTNFFRRMPPPERNTPSVTVLEPFRQVEYACRKFEEEYKLCPVAESPDPDAAYILEHIKKADSEVAPASYIIRKLGMLALSKGVAEDDDTLKARYLRYCRWILQGRKDETAHFGLFASASPAPSVSKAFLPESTVFRQCAECGKKGSTKQCSGCSIRDGNHTTFAVSYCGKECQQNHWKKHKALCRQIRQIHRAIGLFQDIFEHFLALTAPSRYVPTEITETDGMVMVKLKTNRQRWLGDQPDFIRFPLELAPSPDIARAALMHVRSWEILNRARTFFEMLIRPFCAKVQAVLVDPKNMELTGHLSHPDWDDDNTLKGHEVILATLPCGETVVLDPTAAAFGWKEHISLWSVYREHRVHQIRHRREMGPETRGMQDIENPGVQEGMKKSKMPPNNTTSMDRLEQRLMETVVLSLQAQVKARFGGVKEFLQLKDDEFAAASAAFVAAAKRGLTMLADEINDSAEIKIIQPPSATGNSSTKEGSSQKEIVWSTARGKLVSQGNANRQRRWWKARWDKEMKIEWPPVQTN